MPSAPSIGAHVSIAGSLMRAIEEASELGCDGFQIFTHSPRMWKAPPLSQPDVARFRAARTERGFDPVVVHGSYLLNLASPDRENRARSIRAFRDEVERAVAVGADYLVIHPGSAKGYESVVEAIVTLGEAIAEATQGVDWKQLTLLLENTAGGGQSLGRDFGELAAARAAIEHHSDAPVGFCIDTCHTFAAGFDITTPKGLRETLGRIDREIGLEAVRVIHANDSKAALGSHIDRHEHIGEGKIGAEAFRRILRHPKLKRKPFILETPHGPDGTHRKNVEALRKLV